MDLHAGSNDSESVRALFDTGAVTSVLSTNAFKWLQARGAVKATVPTQGLVLQTADGSPLKMTGAHLMKFRFRKQQLEGVFVTVPMLNSCAIIGMNVITPNFLTLCPGTLTVVQGTPDRSGMWSLEVNTVGQDTQWEHAEIRVQTKCSVDALEAARVKCKLVLPDQGGRCVGANTPFFGHIMGLPIHAITNDKGFCHLYVPNASYTNM